jgi:hypothetical protein
MPRLDTDAEGEDGQEHRPGLHLAHCLKQPARESESMKQPKEESSSEPAPAPARFGQKTFWSATKTMLADMSGSTTH